MRPGTRPAQHIYKLRKFRFGAVSPAQLQDFCVDPNLYWPDQDAENAPTECVGYASADYFCDVFRRLFSPDFSYAAARYVGGDGPGTDGASFHAGMEARVAVGALPASTDPMTSALKGEQYVSDWRNWSDALKRAALGYAQNG